MLKVSSNLPESQRQTAVDGVGGGEDQVDPDQEARRANEPSMVTAQIRPESPAPMSRTGSPEPARPDRYVTLANEAERAARERAKQDQVPD